MKKNVTKPEEEKTYKPGLIIAVILLIVISVGLIVFVYWLINQDFTTEVSEKENKKNSLLKLLNDNITKTKVGEEQPADEITTFGYTNNHFQIAGCNKTTVYQFDIDLSNESLATPKDAFDFVSDNDVDDKYEMSLTRWSLAQSDEFNSKYVTAGVEGKYCVGQFETQTIVFATFMNDEKISVINGDSLTNVLSDSYKILEIKKDNPLYDIYKNIIIE